MGEYDNSGSIAELVQSCTSTDYYLNFNPNYELGQFLLGNPANRRIRVINVGTGLTSICLAYHLSKNCQNFELTLFEKSSELGGVWNHNRYPGIACDIPSHVYQFNFAPNPDWPKFFSAGESIREYLNKVADILDLRKYMKFSTEVIQAEWKREGFWQVKLRSVQPDGSAIEFVQEAEILVNNSGTQHKFSWPKIAGLDRYKGRLLHTADWDEDFDKSQWAGKTVTVIGGGASAVQVVPQMQPHVKDMNVFCRTPVWFSPSLVGDIGNPEYSDQQKLEFRKDPKSLVAHAKSIEGKLNQFFPAFYHGSEEQKLAIKALSGHMRKRIHDDDILQKFTPKFPPGCRRVTPGDAFIDAIQQSNTHVIFKSVVELSENGVIDDQGQERQADCVVCATGFTVDFVPTFDIVGKEGIRMSEQFRNQQDTYMGIGVPGFPNYFYGAGPYWTTANGSLIDPINTSARYVAQVIRKLQTELNIKAVTPKQEAMDDFVEHAQSWLKNSVWAGDCPSWYKVQSGPNKGRTNAVWPGITLHFVRALQTPRWEDYDIEYQPRSGDTVGNRFSYLGNGLVQESVDPALDDTPHLDLKSVDPRWAVAIGLTPVPEMQF